MDDHTWNLKMWKTWDRETISPLLFSVFQNTLEALLFLRGWWVHSGWVSQAARPLHLGEEYRKPGEDPTWDQRRATFGCCCKKTTHACVLPLGNVLMAESMAFRTLSNNIQKPVEFLFKTYAIYSYDMSGRYWSHMSSTLSLDMLPISLCVQQLAKSFISLNSKVYIFCWKNTFLHILFTSCSSPLSNPRTPEYYP